MSATKLVLEWAKLVTFVATLITLLLGELCFFSPLPIVLINLKLV